MKVLILLISLFFLIAMQTGGNGQGLRKKVTPLVKVEDLLKPIRKKYISDSIIEAQKYAAYEAQARLNIDKIAKRLTEKKIVAKPVYVVKKSSGPIPMIAHENELQELLNDSCTKIIYVPVPVHDTIYKKSRFFNIFGKRKN